MRLAIPSPLLLLSIPLLLGAGCVEKTTELTASERAELESFVSATAPSPEHALDVSYQDMILLLGYDVNAESWAPGATITVTWHWKVERAIGEGWQLFTHLADTSGATRGNHDGQGRVRALYPPGRWKAGEYIRDVQELTLPEDWDSTQAVLYLGLWNGPDRLPVTRGPSDGDDRARALTLPTPRGQGAAPSAEVPTYRASKIGEPPTIDGVLDEPSWQRATPSTAFVQTMSGEDAAPETTARLLWDDAHLYVAFEVADDFLRSTFEAHDENLWEQDCVEIYLDPSGRGRNYFEMQIAPTGVVFDTRYDSRRVPQPHGHKDWQSELRAGVQLRGQVNDDGRDEGYTVEVAIPWAAFGVGSPPASRPSPNANWRLNLYVMDSRPDGQRAVAWSPPRVGDFHVPARFGRLLFIDPSVPAATVVPLEQPAAPPPGALTPTAPPLLQGLQDRVGAPGQNARQRMEQRLHEQAEANRPRAGEPVPGPSAPVPGTP
ncbi:MAG: carbohydrate-binding family 9-like protein [Myxococcales bacterium]|nr:carbohydrate-binding family 9-like protein [Myxococcales bacterium]